ncbi:MAG: hypothetical protein AABY18_08900 [Candidatus Thermoplasmatota archaeon]
MSAWREHLKALLVILGGTALGALWVVAEWIGDDPQDSVLESLPVLILGFILLGAAAQRWLSPGMTAGLAVAFLAGQMAASDEYDFRNNVELDGFGEYPPIFFVVLIVVGVAVGCALLGHWLVGALRAPRKAAPPTPQQ